MDFLGEALPYVLPLALAVVAALISPALVTPRKLRQDLAIDVELVDKLPLRERDDLSEDIKRRARRLIAMTRHPPLTLYDVLALLGLTAIVVTVIVSQVVPMAGEPDDALIEPLSLGLPAIFAVSCWGAFYVPWGTRAKARLEHIHSHLGDAEAHEAERTLRVAFFAALLAGPGAILGMQVATAVVVYRASDRDWGVTSHAIVGGALGLLVIFTLLSRVKLFDTLLKFNEAHQRELHYFLEHDRERRRKRQRRERRRAQVEEE